MSKTYICPGCGQEVPKMMVHYCPALQAEVSPEVARYMKWSERFFDVAELVASWSKDPSTKVGAVAVDLNKFVVAEGYNDHPRGVHDEDSRRQRPEKYLWTVHAEANLVAAAARNGHSLQGTTVYCTHQPCAQCAALLIQAGVTQVIYNRANRTHMGDDTFRVSEIMFREAGVSVHAYDRQGGKDANVGHS